MIQPQIISQAPGKHIFSVAYLSNIRYYSGTCFPYFFVFLQTTLPVECSWTGFVDTESPIKEYRIMMGNAKGDDSIFSGGSVPGNVQKFSIQGNFK